MRNTLVFLLVVFWIASFGQKATKYSDAIGNILFIDENDSVEFFNIIPGGLWHYDYYYGKISKSKGGELVVSFPPLKNQRSRCIAAKTLSLNDDSVRFNITDNFGKEIGSPQVCLSVPKGPALKCKIYPTKRHLTISKNMIKPGTYLIIGFGFLPVTFYYDGLTDFYDVILMTGFINNTKKTVTMTMKKTGDSLFINKFGDNKNNLNLFRNN